MKVLITGSNGFIGKNLRLFLSERSDLELVCFSREHSPSELSTLLDGVHFVFHLAGVNRPTHAEEFTTGNANLTALLCNALAEKAKTGNRIPVIYTSSSQAERDNDYGRSKRAAEELLFELQGSHQVPVHIFRLPNVFGKWCKPNYNSAVATFCHNIARDLPIQINDPRASLTLVYIDDVVQRFAELMDDADAQTCDRAQKNEFEAITPQYQTTVGELAQRVHAFKGSRSNLSIERVGDGFMRALYSTYVSYLPTESFAYEVPQHADPRGRFVEMLKTPDAGQFSFFTAHPGVTRGGHYHHTKTEKFLVIQGQARFKFRHMHSQETFELMTNGEKAEIVETVPGWTHDITNIGSNEMIVMLWANEIFDRSKPDTYACPV